MPDICMCKNQTCTQKETCYRFMAEPNPYNQSYCTFGQNNNNECEYYWKNNVTVSSKSNEQEGNK